MGRRIVVPSPPDKPRETAFDRSVRERMAIEAETRAMGEARRNAIAAPKNATAVTAAPYVLEDTRRYDRPMPINWGASLAEWRWFCWRTKGRAAPSGGDSGKVAR